MKRPEYLRVLFLLPIFLLSFATFSRAELRLTPSISIREEYNDNIFLTPDDKRDDFITTINPAIALLYDKRLINLSLDYGLILRYYSRDTERNETAFPQTQRARLNATLSPYREIIFIGLSDEYQRLVIDERRQVAMGNISVNMTNTNHFIVNPYIEYPLTRTFKARVGYSYENLWYEEEEGDDTENNSATFNIIKELSPKVTTSLSYTYLLHRPKRTDIYDRQDISLNIAYKIGPRLTLNGTIGQIWFDYEKRDDINSSNMDIQANYLLTELLSITGGYSVTYSESVNFGTYSSNASKVTFGYTGDMPVTLTIFRNINTYTIINREDRSTGVNITSTIPVTQKLTGRLRGDYTHYEFIPEGERVDRYGALLSLDYGLRITTLSIGYTYNLNNSDIDTNDYMNNIVWMQTRFVI
jgi:hypothetical protein